jgi:tripartite-type tricarboxylate transporter receptor subunit TctC
MHITRSLLCACLSLAALALVSGNALAQSPWPARPITWIVPYSAGGITDITSRAVARRVSEILGTPVQVENKAGAAAMIGTEAGARAAPDGYTVTYISTGPVASNPHLYKSMRYDPFKDFVYVQAMFASPTVLVVPAASPFRSLTELIEFARKNPGKLSYGSPGAGTAPHLGVELLALNTETRLTHVPYKGSAPALTDLIGGRIDFVLDYPPTLMAHIESGRLRPLAVMSDRRFSFLPQVPASAELGYGKGNLVAWTGLAAPAGTPAPIVARLAAAVREALADPAVVAPFEKLGTVTLGGISEDRFRAFALEEYTRLGQLIRHTGLTLD